MQLAPCLDSPLVADASVRIEGLAVRFGPVTALADVDLALPAGAITALLGPNGAGKTTLVDVISGLRRPTAGRVSVLGHDPGDPRALCQIGVMAQEGGLYPTARALEWLHYLARLYPDPADPRALLERVGLDPASRTPARRMSGGEQQRLKLAAALLPRPRLLVLDEPTAGLDPAARRRLLDDLDGIRDAGTAILLTTHLMADVEDRADHLVLLVGGRIRARGTIAELAGRTDAVCVTIDRHAGRSIDTGALAAALPGDIRVEVTTRGLMVIGSPTPALIAAIAAALAAQGVLATQIRAGGRSLEDIVIDAERE